MATVITLDTVRGMMEGGLVKGVQDTDFGKAVVRTSMYKGMPIFTVTFIDMKEKWAIIEGEVIGAEFKDDDVHAGEMVAAIQPKERTKATVEALVGEVLPPITPGIKDAADFTAKKLTTKKEEKKMAKVGKDRVVPRVSRPKTALAKEKAATGTVKEQPPTARAYKGRPVDKTARPVLRKGKLVMAVPKVVSKKSGPVPKVGVKEPVLRRQLGWDGKPEKVNINIYSHKIICKECGQPRYVDPRNAGIKAHPVTLCKPCAATRKRDEHNRRVRERNAKRRVEALKAARKAAKAARG